MTRKLIRQSVMTILFVLSALVSTTQAWVNEATELKVNESVKKALAESKALQEKHKDDEHLLILPGLIADKKARTIELTTFATSLDADDPVEFLLTSWDSGKDYEATVVTVSQPSDVDKALKFIGMKPGTPVNFNAMRYWPKGERVDLHFTWEQPPAKEGQEAKAVTVRAEKLIWDKARKDTLPETGFVYSGAAWVEDPDTGELIYSADISDAKSMASTFNSSTTVLDVPRRALQGEVYERYFPNMAYRFETAQKVKVTLKPASTDRVVDLIVNVKPNPDTKASSQLLVEVRDEEGHVLNADRLDPIGATAVFAELVDKDKDPFVHVNIADDVTIKQAALFYRFINALEGDEGIRLEPARDQLFYPTFLVNQKYRDRRERLFQPWELYVTRVGDGFKLKAIEIDPDYSVDPPKLNTTERIVEDGSAFAKWVVEADKDRPRAIIAFVPEDMKYGQLVEIVRPVWKTHPQIYVFTEK